MWLVTRLAVVTFVTVSITECVIIQTTSRSDRRDDIIFSGVDPSCSPEGRGDCSNAGVTPTDALIKPVGHDAQAPSSPMPPATPRTPRTTTIELLALLKESSGDEPCDDDADCNDQSSGSDRPAAGVVDKLQPTDDSIYFDNHSLTEKDPRTKHAGDHEWSSDDKTSTRGPRTTTESLVIRENMTVAPPRKPLQRITTRAPVGQRTTPPKGRGRGSGYVTEEAPPPLPKSSSPQDSLKINIGLIGGIAGGVILLFLVLIFALYKYRSRDEGTYKVDEGKNYGYEVCGGATGGSNGDTNGSTTKCGGNTTPPSGKRKKKDVKEWYV